MERITMRCLDKEPAGRPPTVQDLDRALAAAAVEIRRGPVPPEPSFVPGLQRPTEAHPDPSTAETDELPATPEPPTSRREPIKHTGPIDAALSSPRLPWVAGAVLLTLLGVLAAVLMARAKPPTPAPAPVQAHLIAPAILDSDPSGAVVLRGDEFLGTTPIAIEIPPGERWNVTLQKVGHSPEAVDLWAGARLTVVLPPETSATPEVQPAQRPAPRAAKPARRPPRSEATPAPKRPASDLRDPWGD
jgi:hypothetical protein